MASGNVMVPTNDTPKPKRNDSMKGKTSSKKPAGKMAVQPGPSGKMHKFSGAGTQKPGGTAQAQHAGKGESFPSGGPSGKMQKFTPIKPQKPGKTSQSNSGGGGYAKS